MDELDKQILVALQEQGRISMTDLGRTVSLSQPAVTERVRRLEEKGIIDHYRAVISPEKINKSISAFVLFYTKNCDSFVEYCREAKDVIELHRISGHQYNFLVKIVTESLQSLELAINKLGAYGDSTTLIVLSSPIKQDLLIP
ncbi:Lrp/AsnC family transcriptional regulator [Paenibacillus nanensis]|uniref:Lrp/AsnC family transcriptional regulator n=1 Tax=Paenibacillus nanensis TaxID=393251 RepID=A0A3A1USV1_9BACL|nr:Lrp/AsnC family transcriptional regulator [Paenibacillus nanensis]RIX50252.1 Lrp/AsnC family transcriptional regulator [Paenibacillus nanensis]